jgi:hypothetical protein
MHQFLTWRFWLALGALAALAAGVVVISSRSDPAEPLSSGPVVERRIDAGGRVRWFRPDAGWAVRNGTTVGSAEIVLADGRTFLLGEGTPGEVGCETPRRSQSCTLLASLLGEAIIWFALVPSEPGDQLTMPGPVAVLDEGREARLSNGWVVPLLDVVRRECATTETSSFRDWVARIGADSESIYDLTVEQITTVTCLPP